MTIEEQAEIHGSLAEILTALAILVPKFGTEYGRMAAKHEARAARCASQLELARLYSTPGRVGVTPPSDSEQTDDQPQEGSTEGEVPAQRDPEGEEGSEAEDEVTG